MKLKELIDAIGRELDNAALDDRRARLSLAFAAKRSADGEVECDFVDASALSRAKAEELHHLELILGKKRAGTRKAPRRQVAESALPKPVKRSDLDRPIEPELAELDRDDPDTPAYFRRLLPGLDPV